MIRSPIQTKVLIVLLALFSPFVSLANSNLLFEGYYKLELSGKHIGYYVIRFEGNKKNKEVHFKSYLRSYGEGRDLNESLFVKSTIDFKPISYKYTYLQGTNSKTIDANVNGSQLFLKISNNKKLSTKKIKLKERSFFSSFLTYVLLASKVGIKVGQRYDYVAISEEDGLVQNGYAYVSGEKKIGDVPSYKVLNNFKKMKFVNFLAMNGESLSSISPQLQFSAKLVKTRAEAVGKLPFSPDTLKLVFGSLPEGKKNVLFYKDKKPASFF